MIFVNYIVDNYVLLFELIGLLIMLKISAHVSKTDRIITIWVICLLLTESVASSLEIWTQSFETLSIARPLLTAIKYSIYPVIIFLLMQITITKKSSKKKVLLFLIPEIICVPIFFTSQWTKIVTYYDETNHYHGGPLNLLPYVLFAFYTVLFLVYNIIYFKEYSKSTQPIILYLLIGSFIGATLYMSFLEDYDFTDLLTSSIVLYYLCFYIHLSKVDPLTTIGNRQSYYHDIISLNDDITGVVSIDMNNLKLTNDTYGHEAGDVALRTIALVMKDYCGKKGLAYRIGGDEFVILYLNAKEEEIVESINRIKKNMDKTPYSCAYGYEMRERKENIEYVVRVSDQKMYDNKALIKEREEEK